MFKQSKEIYSHFKAVVTSSYSRQESLSRFFYMYGHTTIKPDDLYIWNDDFVKLNIVQSAVDALVAKIAKNTPRPFYVTDTSDWKTRIKAEKKNDFILGIFQQTKTYQKTPIALLQALVYGDGFIKVYSQSGEIIIEPANTLEIFVDPSESVYGEPRQLWQTRLVDRKTLSELYPQKKEIIERAKRVVGPFYLNSESSSDLVLVIEYWRLANKNSAGEHRLLLEDNDLIPPEAWNRAKFPFAKIGMIKNLVGYFSKGVAETLLPFQIEINKTIKRISDSIRLVASPKVLYDFQSKIVKSHFNNDVGAMIGYVGNPPVFITPQAVSPELFRYLESLIELAYREVGISMLSVSSMKPAGLNSGRALREYNDIETERFSTLAKNWEQFHIDIAELVFEECEELENKGQKIEAMVELNSRCKKISFKESKLDSYLIKVYPTSMLPKTPAGRLEYVQEMLAAGLISPQEGLSLLEFPDTSKITKFKNSQFEDILYTIDIMLDREEYIPPEPFQDLQNGIKYMQSAYLYYKREGCPNEKLDLLLRWIMDATAILQPPQEENLQPNIEQSTLQGDVTNTIDQEEVNIEENQV